MLAIEWINRNKKHGLEYQIMNYPVLVRWGFYFALALVIVWQGGSQQEFIYFQF